MADRVPEGMTWPARAVSVAAFRRVVRRLAARAEHMGHWALRVQDAQGKTLVPAVLVSAEGWRTIPVQKELRRGWLAWVRQEMLKQGNLGGLALADDGSLWLPLEQWAALLTDEAALHAIRRAQMERIGANR